MVFYPSFELFNTVRGYHANSQENLMDNRVKGFLSPASSRKIRDLVENWVNACKADQLRTKKSLDFYLCFVTLTLPASQVHCDRTIKRECLNKFLIYAKRYWKVKNFVWKAEPQENGNLHFHIIFDRFIPWDKIRSTWNTILSPLGYIERYSEKWGSNNPNSTDVHGLKKDKNGRKIVFVGAYLAKYMSKKASTKTGKERKPDRPICGRVWGCSDRLKELKCFKDFDSLEVQNLYDSLKNNQEIGEFSGEFFRVFTGPVMTIAPENIELMKKIDLFFWNQYKKINDLIETE